VADLSPTTGEEYYSGDFQGIKDVLSVLNIGEGKLDSLNRDTINRFQERVDREIDGILQSLYLTPLVSYNQVQPNGNTVRVFPGDVAQAARYWTAGLVLMDQFQQLDSNLTEQAGSMIENAKQSMFAIIKYSHRIPGQDQRSNISRTMPPSMQPPSFPEPR